MTERARGGAGRAVRWALGAGAVAGLAWLLVRQARGGPGGVGGSLVERLEDTLLRLTDAVEAGWDALLEEMERVRQSRAAGQGLAAGPEGGGPH